MTTEVDRIRCHGFEILLDAEGYDRSVWHVVHIATRCRTHATPTLAAALGDIESGFATGMVGHHLAAAIAYLVGSAVA
jgi:hypothetical protein